MAQYGPNILVGPDQSPLFAEQAYRVLAVAMREVVHQPDHIEVETIENDWQSTSEQT